MAAISELRRRFEQVVDSHYEGLWSYVRFLTRGAAESEDILHQAFLLAFDRLAAGREFTGDVGKWLRGTARNLVRAWWRERRKLSADVADHLMRLTEEADDAFTVVANRELRAALDHCLGKLPPADRHLVARRYEEGLRVTQIAEQLRRNVATVRTQLFRIRQALKACVDARMSGEVAT